MREEKSFYVAIKGLIFCGSKFLIIQRSDKSRGEFHYWEFPGGRMEFGEKPEDTLKREVKEETGLEVEMIYPFSVWTFFRESHNQTVGINFVCVATSQDVKLSNEHIDFKWIEKADIFAFDLHPTIADEIYQWNWEEMFQKIKERKK